MSEDYEVEYWTNRFGVSKERLQSAVDRAGVGVDAVARNSVSPPEREVEPPS